MARVIDCLNNADYMAAIGNAGDSLILVEFLADWTTPSQVISNEIGALRLDFPEIFHLRVDFDICPVRFT